MLSPKCQNLDAECHKILDLEMARILSASMLKSSNVIVHYNDYIMSLLSLTRISVRAPRPPKDGRNGKLHCS